MNPETIDPPTKTSVHRTWRTDAQVDSCFRDLYRRLLLKFGPEDTSRVVGVTSCQRGEGVSTVAARLAIAAAEEGEQKVLVVDANPHHSSIHRTFAIEPVPGFLDVIRGSYPLAQVLRPSALENLWVLPAGMAFPRPPTVEREIPARQPLDRLSLEFSFIIVDMPAVDQLGDSFGLMTAVDGILLVVESAGTGRLLARAATDALSPARVLGAVLNKR